MPRSHSSPVLVRAPLGNDAAALGNVLESAGLEWRSLKNPSELAEIMDKEGPEGALFLIASEEGADDELGSTLGRILRSEPEWAQLPILFLTDSARRPPPALRMFADGEAPPFCIQIQRPASPRNLRQIFTTFAASRERQFNTRDLINSLRREEERSSFLLAEMRHRVRNSLAILQALFRMSVDSAESLDELAKAFGDRLQNMSDAHLGLTGEVNVTMLADLMREHVAPYAGTSEQLVLSGEPVELREKAAFDLALVAHELATNAAKYGALSTTSGRVEVTWTVAPESGTLQVTWQERGGPPVKPPSRYGLGTSLVASFAPTDDTEGEISFHEEGVTWEAALPPNTFTLPESGEG